MDRHDSQRGYFAAELYNQMKANPDIFLVVGGLGYKMFDKIFEEFPDRAINCEASEQAMVGIAVGLALKGKIPFVYSITSFLLWRAAETIRIYLSHEQIPVKLVGSGRDQDYSHDGFSHDATDAPELLSCWSSIKQYWPEDKDAVTLFTAEMVDNGKPSFLSLRRK